MWRRATQWGCHDFWTQERVENRHEQANQRGELELIENRRTWMSLELQDEDGYLGRLSFPMEKKHKFLSKGDTIYCLILSDRKDFSKVNMGNSLGDFK